MSPRSKLQQLVLSTYRQFLQAARGLDPSVREQIRREFREEAKEMQPSDLLRIEHRLRRATRELEQLNKANVVSVGTIKINRS